MRKVFPVQDNSGRLAGWRAAQPLPRAAGAGNSRHADPVAARGRRAEGLTTAIIVDQQHLGADPRSTVGTATDASAMLRILFNLSPRP